MEDMIVEVERVVLSSIIFYPDGFEDIASLLKPEDFAYPPHREIFRAIDELFKEQYPLDEEFIRTKLRGGGDDFDSDITDIISTNPIADVPSYARLVKNRSIKKELNKIANNIREYTGNSDLAIEDLIDTIQAELYKVTLQTNESEIKEIKTILSDTMDMIKKNKEKGNTLLTGVDTGFKELNRMTTGFNEGDLVILAARPAMGKTAFALNIAQKALDSGEGVVIFSLEMPAEQLLLRMLAAKTSISLQNLRVGNLTDDEWSSFTAAYDEMSTKSFFVDDSGSINIHQLRAKLRKLKSRHKEIKLAVIDYLQLMSGGGARDRHLEVSEISRGLKLLARELDIPIMALSQLNRGLESRSDKRPMLSDLRESGAIEQDADIILFVYRESVYRLKEEKEKEEEARKQGKQYDKKFYEKNEENAEVIIGKQRNGPTGVVNLVFHKHCTRFMSKDEGFEIAFTQGKFEDSGETKIDHTPI